MGKFGVKYGSEGNLAKSPFKQIRFDIKVHLSNFSLKVGTRPRDTWNKLDISKCHGF